MTDLRSLMARRIRRYFYFRSSIFPRKITVDFALVFPLLPPMDWQKLGPIISGGYKPTISLSVIEATPTIALSIFDDLSIGGGIRFIYGEGDENDIVAYATFKPSIHSHYYPARWMGMT